jgi:hypothetical protein
MSMRAQTAIVLLVTGFLLSASAFAAELRGFPAKVRKGETRAGPTVGDVDGDGKNDIVVGLGSQLHALGSSGRALPGFPVDLGAESTDADRGVFPAAASICALTNDATNHIVVAGPDDKLHVLTGQGQERAGFPVALGGVAGGPPLCADLDGDGTIELVVAVPKVGIVALKTDGSPAPGFPVSSIKPADSALAAADLVAGGPLEIAVGGEDGRLHVIDGKGKTLPRLSAQSRFRVSGGASLGDLDGDGTWEMVFGSQDFHVYAVGSKDGAKVTGFPFKTGYRIYGAPALGDLNDDGLTDVVVGSADRVLYAVDGQGRSLPGWPVKVGGRILSTPAIGDLDMDGKSEVVATADDGKIYILHASGKAMAGSPFKGAGKSALSPYIADLNGDKRPEVVVVSEKGSVHVLRFSRRGRLAASRVQWPTYGHSANHAGHTRPNAARYTKLRIEPENPSTTQPLKVAYEHSDLDGKGDAGTRIRWFKNGRRQKALDDQREVPAQATRKGDAWQVEVQEGDDYALFKEGRGARLHRSEKTKVKNTPPGAPGLASATASAVRVTDAIAVKVAQPAKDDDGDKISYLTQWTLNEKILAEAKGRMGLPRGKAKRGDRVAVVVIPSDGKSKGKAASHAWVVANAPPQPPAVQWETKQIARGQGAALKLVRPGRDPDGDDVVHRVTWKLDGKVIPINADGLRFPGALLVRGTELLAEVRAFDGRDHSAPTTLKIKVGNARPGAPEVKLFPEKPTAGTPLGLRLDKGADDPDRDPITYRVTWRRDGQVQAALTNKWEVPGNLLKRGARWEAEVVAHDGVEKSKPVKVKTLVHNRPPIPPGIALSPLVPAAGEAINLDILRPASDPDGGKPHLKVVWTIDGKKTVGSTRGLPNGKTKKGQKVQVQVRAHDGQGESQAVVASLVVGDRPPETPTVRLSPATLRSGGVVKAELTREGRDPDGDAVAHLYAWEVNGARVPDATTATFQADGLIAGDKIRALVWALADEKRSPVASAELEIKTTKPTAPEITISPRHPRPKEPLFVHITKGATDVDGEVLSYRATWSKNGGVQSGGMDGIASGKTRKGEKWTVRVVATDGQTTSDAATDTVTVGNTRPLPARLTLSKHRPATTDAIQLKINLPRDADGDAVKARIRWSRNGQGVSELNDQKKVPAEKTRKGETWTVAVTVNDGNEDSVVSRDQFTVINTPPPTPSLKLEPDPPGGAENIRAVAAEKKADVDGDKIQLPIAFFVNGSKVKSQHVVNGRELKHQAFVPGDVVEARTHASDGQAQSLPVAARVRVKNSAPNLEAVKISFSGKGTRADKATCAIRGASDPDGDATRAFFRFFADGRELGGGASASTLNLEAARVGQTIQCEAWVSDGVNVSGRKKSETFKIKARTPGQGSVVLTPSQPRTGEGARCGLAKAAADPDGHRVLGQVQAAINGKVQASAEIPPGVLKRGDRVTCSAALSVGGVKGARAASEATVKNALPGPPRVELKPSSPRAEKDSLRCDVKPAVDPEGDALKYRISWFRDGKRINLPPSAAEIPAKDIQSGELWSCRAAARDAEGEGPPGASLPIRVE